MDQWGVYFKLKKINRYTFTYIKILSIKEYIETTVALFMIAKNQKQPKFPSMIQWTNKLYTYNVYIIIVVYMRTNYCYIQQYGQIS